MTAGWFQRRIAALVFHSAKVLFPCGGGRGTLDTAASAEAVGGRTIGGTPHVRSARLDRESRQ